jgi:hypothetical protein
MGGGRVVPQRLRDCRLFHRSNHPASAQIEYAGPYDVLVIAPDGGVQRDSLAQSDIVITVDKRNLSGTNGARYRGTLMADTLAQIRALLRQRYDLF